MKKYNFLILFILLLSPAFSVAQDCEDWQGFWDVDYADANERIWVLETATPRNSTMFPCMISGTQITNGVSYTPFLIYRMEFNKNYIFTENVGELSQTMPMTDMDLDNDVFTATTGGGYPILSGSKTADLCMTVIPNSVTIDGVTGASITAEVAFTEDSWPDDPDNATAEFAGDISDNGSIWVNSVDAFSKKITVSISVEKEALSSVGMIVFKDIQEDYICQAGFKIISGGETTQVVTDDYWGQLGTGKGEFSGPSSLAIDAEGNVYVVDTKNDRIQKFDEDGYFIEEWGSKGSGDGEFIYPSGIAIDSEGNILIVDERNYRIQKFDSNAEFITSWGTEGAFGTGLIKEPIGIAVDSSDNVYVADAWQELILVFDSDGEYITSWGDPDGGTGMFSFRPADIAIDASGNVFVSDYYHNEIYKFDTIGTYDSTWGSEGTGNGEFSYPSGLDVDSSGNLYVVDTFNHRVQQLDSNGEYIAQWGSEGNGVGEFNWPFDVAVSSSGKIYVVDTFNHRIQILKSSDCIAMSLLGRTDLRIDTLRKFRDEVLTDSAAGRKLIELYYQYSPELNEMLNTKPKSRKMFKGMLEASMPVIEMLTQ